MAFVRAKSGERLIEQKDIWIKREYRRDFEPPLLAMRQRIGNGILAALQSDPLESVTRNGRHAPACGERGEITTPTACAGQRRQPHHIKCCKPADYCAALIGT